MDLDLTPRSLHLCIDMQRLFGRRYSQQVTTATVEQILAAWPSD